MTKLTPPTERLFEIVADGRWYSIEYLKDELAPLYPSELAQAYLDSKRASRRKRTGHLPSATAARRDAAGISTESARRMLVLRTIHNHFRSGNLERKGGEVRSTGKLERGVRRHPSQQEIYTRKLYDILGDGQRHSLEEIQEIITRHVPPEKGYRAELQARDEVMRRRGKPSTLGKHGADPHRSGQRRIAVAMISNHAKRGKVVIENGMIWKAEGHEE